MTYQAAKMRPERRAALKMVLGAVAVPLAGLLAGPDPVLAQYMDLMMVIDGIGTRRFYRDAERVVSANAIRVDRLSTLLGARYGRARLEAKLALYPEAIRFLQEQLAFNPIARRDIRNQGFDIGDIVYLHVAGDGGTTVYADDLD